MSIHDFPDEPGNQPRKNNWWLFGLSVLFMIYVVFIGLQLPTDTELTKDTSLAFSLLFAGISASWYGVTLGLPGTKWLGWIPAVGFLAMSAIMFVGAVFVL